MPRTFRKEKIPAGLNIHNYVFIILTLQPRQTYTENTKIRFPWC